MDTTLDLFAAVDAGNAQSVEAALVGGALPDQFDRYGRTPLIYSIQLWDRGPRFKDVVPVLLAAGARVDLKSFNDWTPLMHAASLGYSEACEMLLAAGADPNAANLKGRTALMVAAYHLQEAVLRLLFQRGAAPTPADAQGRTALDFLDARAKDKFTVLNVITAGSELRGRIKDKQKFMRCQKLLKAAGAKKGKGRISTRAQRRLRHFTADELTQSRHSPVKSRKFLVFALLLSLLAVPFVHAGWWGAPVALVGAVLLLNAFPSILQLPYLLLAPRSERSVEVSGPSDDELTAEVGAGQLDAVSNFLRLGWGQQIQMVRARKVRLTHTRSHLASIGLAAAIVLTVVVVALLGTGSGAVDTLLPAAVTLVALLLEGRLRNSRLKAFQANWDQVAAGINTKLAEATQQQPKQEEPFVLYLRTFGVTGLLNIGGIDFETSMAYNLTPMMPMIALGHPGEAIGAGRILTTDEHWKEEILRLVENASRIMLIPSHREGTQWEIARLKDMNHFGKTVFAMPPKLPFGTGNYSDEWNRAASALTSIGLALPLHYAAGLLFKLGPDGGIVEHAPLQARQFVFELAQLSQKPDAVEELDPDADDDGEGGGDDGGDGAGDSPDGAGDGGGGGGGSGP